MLEGFYLLLTSTDILVLQHFRSPDEVAVYYAAAKTLALVAFVHFAVSAATAHRFAKYHAAADHSQLAEFLRESIRWTFWASLAATVVILAIGRPLLSLFGPSSVEGYPIMFILSLGLLARAAIGPVDRLLTVLGEQRLCALVYALAFALNLVLCVVMVPPLGAQGAAIAFLAETILLFWVTRVRLGLHVFIWGRQAA